MRSSEQLANDIHGGAEGCASERARSSCNRLSNAPPARSDDAVLYANAVAILHHTLHVSFPVPPSPTSPKSAIASNYLSTRHTRWDAGRDFIENLETLSPSRESSSGPGCGHPTPEATIEHPEPSPLPIYSLFDMCCRCRCRGRGRWSLCGCHSSSHSDALADAMNRFHSWHGRWAGGLNANEHECGDMD